MNPRECKKYGSAFTKKFRIGTTASTSSTLHNISAPRKEYHLKEEIRQQKRQIEDLEKELKNSTWSNDGVLTDREKMILHFVCMVTIAKVTGMPNYKDTLETMVKDIRKNRCRSLSSEDVSKLLEDVNEEMIGGRAMFKYLVDEDARSTAGVRPNNNSNCCEDEERQWRDGRINDCDWRDMK